MWISDATGDARVSAPGRELGDTQDHVAKYDRAEPTAHADHKRQADEPFRVHRDPLPHARQTPINTALDRGPLTVLIT